MVNPAVGHHRRMKYRKAHIASSGSRSPLQATWLVAMVAKASEAKTQEVATAERSVFLASLTREAALGRRQLSHSKGGQPVQEDSYRSAAIATALQDVPHDAR